MALSVRHRLVSCWRSVRQLVSPKPRSEDRDCEGLLRPESTTIDTLQRLFHEACFDTAFDDGHELWVKGDEKVLVRVENKGSLIVFSSFAIPRRNANLKECLEFVNRVNSTVNLVRALLAENGLVFEYTLPVIGGVTKQSVIFVLRFFLGATAHAKKNCDDDGLFRAKAPGHIEFSEN